MRLSPMVSAFFLFAVFLAAAEVPASDRAPVVVELFTSEGCSSCPPADRLLAEIEKQMGANVIVLSEHVDYWDYIGWKDPFATTELTARQQRYSRNIGGNEGVYTPQMVIDGRTGFVGSDGKRAQAEIKKASAHKKTQVTIEKRGEQLAISTNAVPANANVLIAITEANLETDVRRGENSGRKLRHTGVVRALTNLGKAERGKTFTAEFSPKLDAAWKRGDLRAVVLVEDRSSHEILGAAVLPL